MITNLELKKCLRYDPETGLFSWIISLGPVNDGDIAGSIHHTGYVVIRHSGRLYAAHRLAFLYMTGSWPNDEIDHINGIRADNRWKNLRECSVAQNRMNKVIYRNNKSAVVGIRWRENDKRWIARINCRGEEIYLGCFQEKEAAMAVRRAAEDKYFGEFRRAV